MKRIVTLLLLLLVPGLVLATPAGDASWVGRWETVIPVPGRAELLSVHLVLEPAESAQVRGRIESEDGDVHDVAGSYDPDEDVLVVEGDANRTEVRLELAVSGDTLAGKLAAWGNVIPVRLTATDEPLVPRRLGPRVEFPAERPEAIARRGLEGELEKDVVEAIRKLVASQKVVGLCAAFVRDGEIVDVRAFGWEDFHGDVPATEKTMYRWASISKPLTAVAALQLVDRGELDLDRDVRELVPEFPDKGVVITSRQLLCHQGGVVHYADMKVRTPREYDVPHPFADRVLALDIFKESDILFEPGTSFSYTTPGFSLLGAVVERAGGATYAEQVKERICEPLGMVSMRPDYAWEEIPHRTRGYAKADDGEVHDSGEDDDITWKLPAGGWISTVEDLARFGIGLMGSDLLEAETRTEMRTDQRDSSGKTHGYGLGIGVTKWEGVLFLSHSGGQKKTSTFLLVCPDRAAGVALMCNTQGTPLGALARDVMLRLLRG